MKYFVYSLMLTMSLGLVDAQMPGAWGKEGGDTSTTSGALDYVCPMHPDERSDKPGKCQRCGMTMRLGIPDQSDYSMELTLTPAKIQPGQKVRLRFAIESPKDRSVVKKFEVVHEKLIHLFIISSDFKFFVHEHPVQQADGSFVIDNVFPQSGEYRVGADVFPSAGSPQLIDSTFFVSGSPNEPVSLGEARLKPDLNIQHGENTDVTVTTAPEKAIAGVKTLLIFKFSNAKGMEKYLGAWAHMLIASEDLVDLIHDHPSNADGGSSMEFAIIFPRPQTYRVWVQFQRAGVVNTVAVNVPVISQEEAEGISTGKP